MQIVIKCDCIGLESSSTASAQGWDVEVNPYHCKDDGGWFWSSIPCDREPTINCYKCQYCGMGFETDFARYQHEATCPNRPQDNNDDNKDGNQPSPNPNPGGGGGSNGNNTGNSNPNSKSKTAYKDWGGCSCLSEIVNNYDDFNVCTYTFPVKIPEQKSLYICVPTVLATLELINNSNIKQDDFYKSLDKYMDIYNNLFPGINNDIFFKGVRPYERMERYMEACGLEKISNMQVLEVIESGSPVLGTLLNVTLTNSQGQKIYYDGHAVTIVGVGTDNSSGVETPTYLIMDPYTTQYTVYPCNKFDSKFYK